MWYALLLCLLLLAWQDFRKREISLSLLVLLLGLVVYQTLQQCHWSIALNYWLINTILLFLQWVLVSLYFVFKHKKWINIIDRYIGWGDIIFLWIISPLFSPILFMWYYSTALILTLMSVGIYSLFNPKRSFDIPLVSGLSIVLIAFLLNT